MTDTEIMKAFEICYVSDEDCSGCPFCDEDGECKDIGDSNLCQDVLDLINRKQAEIEELKEIKDRLMYNLKAVCKEQDEEGIRADAIKEFAMNLGFIKAKRKDWQMRIKKDQYVSGYLLVIGDRCFVYNEAKVNPYGTITIDEHIEIDENTIQGGQYGN